MEYRLCAVTPLLLSVLQIKPIWLGWEMCQNLNICLRPWCQNWTSGRCTVDVTNIFACRICTAVCMQPLKFEQSVFTFTYNILKLIGLGAIRIICSHIFSKVTVNYFCIQTKVISKYIEVKFGKPISMTVKSNI